MQVLISLLNLNSHVRKLCLVSAFKSPTDVWLSPAVLSKGFLASPKALELDAWKHKCE